MPGKARVSQKEDYWLNVENVEKELLSWMQKHGSTNVIPLHKDLVSTGARKLSKVRA